MKRFILSALAILAIAGTLWAADVTVKHGNTGGSSRTVAAADSVAPIGSTDYTDHPQATDNHKTVFVSPHLENSGATCKVALALGSLDGNGNFVPEAWVESGTLTASTTFKMPDGFYATPGAELLTGGYSHFKVYVTALSAGSAKVVWKHY